MLEDQTAATPAAPETTAPAPAPKAAPVSIPSRDAQEKMSGEERAQVEDTVMREAFRKAEAVRKADREADATKPARDPSGKFEAKALAVGGEADKADKADNKSEPVKADKATDQAAAKTEAPKKAAVEAPKHWPDAAKKAFAALDPEAQEAIGKDATDMRQTVSRQGNLLKSVEPTMKVLQEHKASFEKYGLSFDKGVSELLKTHAGLDNPATVRDAHAALTAKLERQHGISLRGQQASEAETEDDWSDPQVKHLAEYTNRLQAEVQQQRQHMAQLMQHLQQQAYDARMADLGGAVEQFASQHEDFADLPEDLLESQIVVARRMNPDASPQEHLRQAYELARWQNAATREKAIAAAIEAKTGQADQARRAASLNVNGHPQASEHLSEDDLMRAAYRKATTRAH